MIEPLELLRKLNDAAQHDGPVLTMFDVSPEDETVTMDIAAADMLADAALLTHDFARRYRKRDVLVAQIVQLMRTAELQHPIFGNDVTFQEQVANRMIDALGVAVLVDGDSPNTGLIQSGEVETMSRSEFVRRMGGAEESPHDD